jgi:hypothetical protein
MGLLDFLKKRDEPRLARLLKSYPPYQAPFGGEPRSWTLDQANANLTYLLEHRTERIAVLRDLLAKFNVEVPVDLSVGDPQPLFAALDAWALAEWPDMALREWRGKDAWIAATNSWIASSRRGPDIVLSMLMDIAILSGELVVTRRPEYRWSLDLDPDDDRDGMVGFLRPMIQIPAGGPFPRPIMFDFEEHVVCEYLRWRNPDLQYRKSLRFVHDRIGWSVMAATTACTRHSISSRQPKRSGTDSNRHQAKWGLLVQLRQFSRISCSATSHESRSFIKFQADKAARSLRGEDAGSRALSEDPFRRITRWIGRCGRKAMGNRRWSACLRAGHGVSPD